MYDNLFCIPLDFEILESHMPFFQSELKDRLSYELTFNNYGSVIVSSDTTATYTITDIHLEFEVLTSPEITTLLKRKYEGKHTVLYDRVIRHSKLTLNEARLIALNWKILSNIYPTNIFLAKIGKARSSNCSKCDVEDYLEHFFFYCKSVKQLWNEVNSIIQVQMGKNVTLSVTTCLFGYYMGSQVENAL